MEHEPELRHTEVELALEGREGDEEAAHEQAAAEVVDEWTAALALGIAAQRHDRLGDEDHPAQHRQRAAADQHQVGRAPQRHVLSEDAMPQVVEREPREREGAGGRDHQPANGRPPVAAEVYGGSAWPLPPPQRHGQRAGEQRAIEPDEDEVVGRVGERAVVATVVDVQGDVPVHPEGRREQRDAHHRRGQGRPTRQARLALGEAREMVEPADAPAAVTRDHQRDDRRDEQRADGRADRLAVAAPPAGSSPLPARGELRLASA
jgi:hypothetical protein